MVITEDSFERKECKFWQKKCAFSDDLIYELPEHHHTPEDFDEGDLTDRINQYFSYDLELITIDRFDFGEWIIDPARVEKIEKEIRKDAFCYPPILYDPINDSIIDGTHRVNALHNLGEKYVVTLVGNEEDYEGM